MDARVAQLIGEFDRCLDAFDAANLFTGPSIHFYRRAMLLRARHREITSALNDEDFLDALYATLTAWGMHRMGPGMAKLRPLEEIRASLDELRDDIGLLDALDITRIGERKAADVTRQLWRVIARLRVGAGETRIVANSKTLHLLLPALVPPIDREYTLRFFYGHRDLKRGDEATFSELFPRMCGVASACGETIRRAAGSERGMHLAVSKVVDNAIVGYVRAYLSGAAVTADR
jgi:hypothetical protein